VGTASSKVRNLLSTTMMLSFPSFIIHSMMMMKARPVKFAITTACWYSLLFYYYYYLLLYDILLRMLHILYIYIGFSFSSFLLFTFFLSFFLSFCVTLPTYIIPIYICIAQKKRKKKKEKHRKKERKIYIYIYDICNIRRRISYDNK
jgi:hypothetical protein